MRSTVFASSMKGKLGARCPSEIVGVFKCTGRTLMLVFPRREQAGVQNLGQRLASLGDFRSIAAPQRFPVTFKRPRGDGEKLATLGFRDDVAHLATLGYYRCANGLAFWLSQVNWLPAKAKRHHSRFSVDETRAAPKRFDRNLAQASAASRSPWPETRICTVCISRCNRKQSRLAEGHRGLRCPMAPISGMGGRSCGLVYGRHVFVAPIGV